MRADLEPYQARAAAAQREWLSWEYQAELNTQHLLRQLEAAERRNRRVDRAKMALILMLLVPALSGGIVLALFAPQVGIVLAVAAPLASVIGLAALVSSS